MAPSLIALALGKETSHFLARPAEPPRSAYPSWDAQEKKKKKKGAGVCFNSLLQINQFHLLHLWLWLLLAVGRCPAPAPTGMAPTPAPENRRDRAPRLPIACPRVATGLWYQFNR